jgi:hypothetical protein
VNNSVACHWVEPDLCSACAGPIAAQGTKSTVIGKRGGGR